MVNHLNNENQRFRAQIDVLEMEQDGLRNVCLEAYQVAGTAGAPTRAMDQLIAAGQGGPLPHEPILPMYLNEFEPLEYDFKN